MLPPLRGGMSVANKTPQVSAPQERNVLECVAPERGMRGALIFYRH